MPLIPADALDEQLNFRGFKKIDKEMPKPGVFESAAGTYIGVAADPIEITKEKVDGKTVYRVPVATVRVILDGSSWVASYVLEKWRQGDRDALRGHEQVHYMIAALSGRDYLEDLDALRTVAYAKAKDGKEAVAAVKARYTVGRIQQIHKAYDAKTGHDAISFPDEQAAWTKAVDGAKASGTNLRVALKAAGLLP